MAPDVAPGEKLLDVLGFGTVRGFHAQDALSLAIRWFRRRLHCWNYYGTFGSRRWKIGLQSSKRVQDATNGVQL